MPTTKTASPTDPVADLAVEVGRTSNHLAALTAEQAGIAGRLTAAAEAGDPDLLVNLRRRSDELGLTIAAVRVANLRLQLREAEAEAPTVGAATDRLTATADRLRVEADRAVQQADQAAWAVQGARDDAAEHRRHTTQIRQALDQAIAQATRTVAPGAPIVRSTWQVNGTDRR